MMEAERRLTKVLIASKLKEKKIVIIGDFN